MPTEASLYTEAERLYAAANRHWEHCPVCGPAGGEGAILDSLCETGRALTTSWEKAEKRYALFEADK